MARQLVFVPMAANSIQWQDLGGLTSAKHAAIATSWPIVPATLARDIVIMRLDNTSRT